MPLQKIFTGGQTGVDRGALDAALSLAFPCGGWCPHDRAAEGGPIPDHYPVVALPAAGYRERTVKNVVDSDGTVVIFFGMLRGGTEQTVLHCARRGKPYKLIDACEETSDAPFLARKCVDDCSVRVLNVARPRLSHAPGAHAYAFSVISQFLAHPR